MKFKDFKFWAASCPYKKEHTELQLFKAAVIFSWQKNNFRATLPLHSCIQINPFFYLCIHSTYSVQTE